MRVEDKTQRPIRSSSPRGVTSVMKLAGVDC